MTRRRPRRPGVAACIGVAAAWLLLGLAHSASAQKLDDFDHLRTRFPLTGAHERVPCEGCHQHALFQGTPT